MQLYHYPLENFGDGPLNRWLWPRLLPGLLREHSQRLLVGIGSLINDTLPKQPLKVVCGAGVGYGRLPTLDASWKFYAVRGPISARRLGLAPELAVTDAAVLVRVVAGEAPAKRHRAAYMPHWGSDRHGHWQTVCERAGLHYIDPLGSVETVLREIQQSELVISEALHGAIVADALRVPWIPVRAYPHILDLKWHDWCQSLALPYAPAPLTPLYQAASVQTKLHGLRWWPRPALLRQAATLLIERPARWLSRGLYERGAEQNARALQRLAQHNTPPQLSAEAVIEAVTERFLERLALLKADYAAGRLPVRST